MGGVLPPYVGGGSAQLNTAVLLNVVECLLHRLGRRIFKGPLAHLGRDCRRQEGMADFFEYPERTFRLFR